MVEVAHVATALEWDTPLYAQARAQLEQALPHAGISGARRRAAALSRAGGHPDAAGAAGRRERPLVSGLPRAALLGARTDEGRRPLRRGRQPGRVRRARDVDDVEVRAPAAALRRRQGRRALQPARALAGGALAAHAALHLRSRAVHRPGDRHPGARHRHERADDGLDDGHLLVAEGLCGAGDRDRQADLDRGLGVSQRGDGRRAS